MQTVSGDECVLELSVQASVWVSQMEIRKRLH